MQANLSEQGRWRLGLGIGLGVAGLLILMLHANIFSQMQLSVQNNFYVPMDASESPIVIVAIDDASLAEYGRSPAEWSRTVYAEFIDTIAPAESRVIAFDLIFSESTDDDFAVAESIQSARASEGRTRFVLAGAGVQSAQASNNLTDFPQSLQFGSYLFPTDELNQVADYIGFTNTFADIDSRVRRQPSVIDIDGDLGVSFSLASYLAYLRIPSGALGQVISSETNTLQPTPELQLTIDDLGLWLQNFFGPPLNSTTQTYPTVSLVDVIQGEVDIALFDDKIVLLGLIQSAGSTDQYPVPATHAGELMAGVEIQANAIQTLLDDNDLQPQSLLSQSLMVLVLSVGSSLAYVHLRWTLKLVLAVILVAIVFVVASIIFSVQFIIVNLLYAGFAIVVPVLLAIGWDITYEIARRQRSEFLLGSVSNVAQQRLILDKILPYVAEDIRHIVPDSLGGIWLRKENQKNIVLAQHWADEPMSLTGLLRLAQRADTTEEAVATPTQVAIPVIWQERLLGVFALQRQGNKKLSSRAIRLLHDLAEQLAPQLENSVLYTEVQQQRDTLDAILKDSPAGIVVVNEDLEIERTNQAFHRIVQADNGATLGNFTELIKQLDMDEKVSASLLDQLSQNLGFRIEEAQLGNRTFNISAAPLQDFHDWVIVWSDISEVSQLSRLKTRMIRMASHDLKNPLSRVLGYSELIQMDENLSESQTRFMEYIVMAGEEMNRLITEILDLEQLRSGGLVLEQVDFAQLTREVVSRHEPDMERKKQTFQGTIPDKVQIVGDYRQLSQVVTNLLGNAVKYTPDEGAISLQLSLDDNSILLSIEDTGYGISKEAQEKLFTDFYRVQSEATSHISGTGLGLSLVKSVVTAHQGEVWVESEEGKGSTFSVSLPILKENITHELSPDDDTPTFF